MDWVRLTPVTRLSWAFGRELTLLNNPAEEAALAEKYLIRLSEAAARRDASLRSLVAIDVVLAMVLSGKHLTVPILNLQTSDIPALLEVVVALASAAAYFFCFSFATWLCYSQMAFVFVKRRAEKSKIDPDLLSFGDAPSEPTLKIFRGKLNLWGLDWYEAGRSFRLLSALYGLVNSLFFLAAPLLHASMIWTGGRAIYSQAGFTFLHSIFYVWILVANLAALLTWLVPSVSFRFEIKKDGNPR